MVRCRAVLLPLNAPAWLDRLVQWLEPFEPAFGHVAQRGAFRRYVLGLLSDSRRKSMSAMLERINDPGAYQAFQHFITDAPWTAARVWQQHEWWSANALIFISLHAFLKEFMS